MTLAKQSQFIPLQNVVYFITLPLLGRKTFTFYINDVLLFKCPIPGPKGSCMPTAVIVNNSELWTPTVFFQIVTPVLTALLRMIHIIRETTLVHLSVVPDVSQALFLQNLRKHSPMTASYPKKTESSCFELTVIKLYNYSHSSRTAWPWELTQYFRPETSINSHPSTRCNIPEDSNLRPHSCDELRCHHF